MSGSIFMTAHEVAEELGVSTSYAYKLIKRLNDKLKETGYIVLAGKIDRRYLYDHIYATQTGKE